MAQSNPIDAFYIYEQFKFWGPVIGATWAAFQAYTWVKEIRTSDLADLQKNIKQLNEKIDGQTDAIVNSLNTQTTEIKTLCSDIKMLTMAFIQPPLMKAARARRKK